MLSRKNGFPLARLRPTSLVGLAPELGANGGLHNFSRESRRQARLGTKRLPAVKQMRVDETGSRKDNHTLTRTPGFYASEMRLYAQGTLNTVVTQSAR